MAFYGTLCGVQTGGHLKEIVWGLTLPRLHLSKFLHIVGSIFQTFCAFEVQSFKFMSILS